MKKGMKVFLPIIIIVIIIAVFLVGNYNNLVTLKQGVSAAESNIDTQLQRRSDLIPNLVNTVKGYATQEKEIFTEIADARAKLAGATNISDQAAADTELSNALSRLLVVQLEGTENRIAIARQDYNTVVTEYNTKILRFPTNIIASLFGFDEKPFYKASAGATEVPSVDFSN